MLVVAASPVGEEDVKATDSLDAIRDALRGLAFDPAGRPLANGPVRVTLCCPPTRGRFEQLLRDEGPWHIVHFVGHGAFQVVGDDPTPSAHLLFERPQTRESDPVGAETLGVLLTLNKPGPRLVVLTACSSAAAKPRDPGRYKYPASAFDGVSHHLLRATDVTAVVAMQFDLEVAAARVFAREFYKSFLLERQDIDVAVGRCRQALATAFDVGTGVWVTPALYSRSRDGRIFEFREPLGLGGMIVDAATLRPVPGVRLMIEDLDDVSGKAPTAVTDEDGRFRFQLLPPSPERQVRLRAEKAGYQISRSDPTLGNMSHTIKLVREGGDQP
jgi:hypothetical protein